MTTRCASAPASVLAALAMIIAAGGCDDVRRPGLPRTAPPRVMPERGAPATPRGIAVTPAVPPVLTERAARDLFAATSWAPPPVAPPAAPSRVAPARMTRQMAPAPVAPPLPFVYVGLYHDGKAEIAMLLKGEQLNLVRTGDTIDGLYRIDRIARDTVDLVYLPLQIHQALHGADSP